jgi:excisionase family DNA binding protein
MAMRRLYESKKHIEAPILVPPSVPVASAPPNAPDLFPYTPEKLLTAKEAGTLLGVSAPTIYRLIRAGELRAVPFKIKWKRVPLVEVERYRAKLGLPVGTPTEQ